MIFIYFKRIKELRIDNKLSQKDIAEKLLLLRQQYQRYESGERDTPNQILLMIANYYNVSLDYIFERTNTKEFKR